MNNLQIFYLDILKPTSNADGSLIHRVELVNNLSKLNVNINAICLNEASALIDDRVDCHLISGRNTLILYIQYLSIFLRSLIFKKFDIIYTRNQSFVFLTKILFLNIYNKKLIFELNGIAKDERKLISCNSKGSQNSSIDFIKEFIFKKSIRTPYKIIAVTSGIKKYLHDEYDINNEKIVVINNGANTDQFKPMDSNESRNKLELDPTKDYVCFVGNLAAWQGVEYLIQAAPLILSKCPNVNFLIVGDGIMKDKWMKLAKNSGSFDKFIFTGSIPHERIPLYINSSNVCVAPFIVSRNAKIGLSALKMYEYLACGKPVVASDIQGVGDLLRKSNGGIAVIPEKSSNLAEGIIKLLRNEQLQKEMGYNGLEFVLMNHSWACVARKVKNIFEELVN